MRPSTPPTTRTDATTLVLLRHLEIRRFFVMGYYLAAAAYLLMLLVLRVLEVPADILLAFTPTLVVLLASGLYFRCATRCPSCDVRIGWTIRLLLPRTCPRCGVALRPSTPGPSR